MKNIIKSLLMLLLILPFSVFAKTEAPIDVVGLSIEEIQEYVDKGVISYEVLTRIYLERIEEYDKDYNSIIRVNENAIERAKELDAEYKESGRRSLIHGIPVLVKDNIDVEGMPTTVGLKALSNSFPYENAKVIENLEDMGAIILGKTNMSEFALYASNSGSDFGYVRNAYNNKYTSYGSSGGSAVSVSLGFSVVSIGTDTNSSVRVPASAAGIYGIRPNTSLLSKGGVVHYDVYRDTVGVFSTSVRDNAIVLDILRGGNGEEYLKKLSNKKVRIGVLTQVVYGDEALDSSGLLSTDKEIVELFNETIDGFESDGYGIVMIDDFFDEEVLRWESESTNGKLLCMSFNEYIKGTNSKVKSFEEVVKDRKNSDLYEYLDFCDMSEGDVQNLNYYEEYKNYVSEVMKEEGVDVLVYPSVKNKVFRYNEVGLVSASYLISPVSSYPVITYNMGYIDGVPYAMEVLGLNEEVIYSFVNNLDNNYRVSENVPSLYDVPIFVSELVNYHKNLNLKNLYNYNKEALELYNDTLDEVVSFFANYEKVDNKDEEARVLLEKYKIAYDTLLNAKSERQSVLLMAGLMAVTVFFVLISIVIKCVKSKKIKKN